MYKKIALIFFILTLSITAFAQKKDMKKKAPDDKKAVLAVVDSLFDNMAAHKPDAIVALHLPDSQMVGLIKQPDGTSKVQSFKVEMFAKNFAVKRGELKEVMYDHKINVQGDLATVSGRYIFFVNDKISHCGVNAFHLARTSEGWRIGGAATTIEPQGCTDKEKAMKAK